MQHGNMNVKLLHIVTPQSISQKWLHWLSNLDCQTDNQCSINNNGDNVCNRTHATNCTVTGQ